MCVCREKNYLQENIYLDEIADTKSKDFLEKKFEKFFSNVKKQNWRFHTIHLLYTDNIFW